MQIIDCDSTRRGEWDDFVRASADGSFYHLYQWRDINARTFGHRSVYLAALDGGRFVGVYPIVVLRSRLFGRIACSMPFVNFGGPCAESPEVEARLQDAARAFCEEQAVDYLEIRGRRRLVQPLPTSEHKVSMTVALDPDPERLFAAYKSAHRQDSRKPIKLGFAARAGGAELLDPFYQVLSESWRDLGTPIYGKDYFARILETFPDNIRIVGIFEGDEPAAAALSGYFGDTAEGMWLGTRAKYRRSMAGYLLYWECLKDACLAGLSRYHLGRSTADSSAEAFKKKWNAYATQLYWQYVLRSRDTMPGLNVANPKFQLAMGVWRKLPIGLTQMVGPAIARSIP